MPLNPQIPLSVRIPEAPSAMQSIAGLMQLRGQLSDIALRQAQIEQARQAAAENEALSRQKNRDLADQNTIQSLETDPAVYAKIHAGDLSPLAGKVQPKTFESVQKFVNDAIEKKMTLDTSKLAQEQAAHKEIGQTLDSLQRMTGADGSLDLDRVNQSLPGAINALSTQLRLIGVDPSQLPKSVHSADELQRMAAQAGALGALTDAALGRKKTQAETEQAGAAAASSQATADLSQFKLNLMKGGSDATAIASQVDALIDPVKFPKANQDAKAAAALASKSGDMSKVADAVQGIYDKQVGALQSQSELEPGEVKKAVDIERATAPIKLANSIAEAKVMRAGDNAAVSGVAPAAIATVQNDAIKLDQEYGSAKSVADSMQHILDLAQSGNKAAGSNIPLVGVETLNALNGIKRINTAEIAQYGTAGSLLDEIKGKLGKIPSGQPVPADVIADIRQLHQTLTQDAYSKYKANLDNLNKRTGSKYDPAYEAPKATSGPVSVKANGKEYHFDSQAQADAFKTAAKAKGASVE